MAEVEAVASAASQAGSSAPSSGRSSYPASSCTEATAIDDMAAAPYDTDDVVEGDAQAGSAVPALSDAAGAGAAAVTVASGLHAPAAGANRTVFVGGLSFRIHEPALRAFFSSFGDVMDMRIIDNVDARTGKSRGFGFVMFQDPAVADRLKELGEVVFRNRRLVIAAAHENILPQFSEGQPSPSTPSSSATGECKTSRSASAPDALGSGGQAMGPRPAAGAGPSSNRSRRRSDQEYPVQHLHRQVHRRMQQHPPVQFVPALSVPPPYAPQFPHTLRQHYSYPVSRGAGVYYSPAGKTPASSNNGHSRGAQPATMPQHQVPYYPHHQHHQLAQGQGDAQSAAVLLSQMPYYAGTDPESGFYYSHPSYMYMTAPYVMYGPGPGAGPAAEYMADPRRAAKSSTDAACLPDAGEHGDASASGNGHTAEAPCAPASQAVDSAGQPPAASHGGFFYIHTLSGPLLVPSYYPAVSGPM